MDINESGQFFVLSIQCLRVPLLGGSLIWGGFFVTITKQIRNYSYQLLYFALMSSASFLPLTAIIS